MTSSSNISTKKNSLEKSVKKINKKAQMEGRSPLNQSHSRDRCVSSFCSSPEKQQSFGRNTGTAPAVPRTAYCADRNDSVVIALSVSHEEQGNELSP